MQKNGRPPFSRHRTTRRVVVSTAVSVLAAIVSLNGCATSSDFFSQLPGFEASTDKVPGLMPPLERKKLIRAKGQKGKTAKADEQELLLGQLLEEFRTSPDKSMRREAIEAMTLIPHPRRDDCLREGLSDPDAFVRISACKGIGTKTGEESDARTIAVSQTFRQVMNEDADKDVRITAMKLAGKTGKKMKPGPQTDARLGDKHPSVEEYKTLVADFGKLLDDKTPSVRYQAMVSLQECTGKDYGMDIDKWIGYTEYATGKSKELPAERTWTEKIPAVKLPMFM